MAAGDGCTHGKDLVTDSVFATLSHVSRRCPPNTVIRISLLQNVTLNANVLWPGVVIRTETHVDVPCMPV